MWGRDADLQMPDIDHELQAQKQGFGLFLRGLAKMKIGAKSSLGDKDEGPQTLKNKD